MPEETFGCESLAALDEVLQVLFWLHGERLASAVAPADLERWLGLEGAAIAPLLARLEARGWVERMGAEERFALTAEGMREGGRRFADEFAELTRQAHGECSDPDCECKRSGDPAACRHVEGAHA